MAGLVHARLQAKVLEIFSRQSHLTALPYHAYEILLAFVMFTMASWFSYYLLAPKLVRYSKRKKVKDDELARVKWGHMLVSFLHAIIVSAWSLYLWYDNSLADSVETRVLGYSKPFGQMFSFSVGYFMWDVLCCLWHIKFYGRGFLIHGLLGLVGLSACYRPFMMYPTSRFLLFETSTIFIDMHWFLEKLGYGGSMLMMVNDAIALVAYMCIRLIFGSYLTLKFLRDLYAMWSQVPLFFSLISLLGNVTTHTLNFYWFYKLGRSAYRTMFGSGSRATPGGTSKPVSQQTEAMANPKLSSRRKKL